MREFGVCENEECAIVQCVYGEVYGAGRVRESAGEKDVCEEEIVAGREGIGGSAIDDKVRELARERIV
ncbi:hypothetical protein COLO4_13758 [Corchorus olitorius]|uniref:Uncharacterized protein n=1 Tax=Corchorus olitorius TaxID=93759 RepID=A0A1R3JV37_9ROSI|nr:hypothetical protein COLO4_13758 [Corchorus olitorius]